MLDAKNKKEVRAWAKANNVDLSFNPKLNMPQSTSAAAIARIIEVKDIMSLRDAASNAMDGNHIAYDTVAHLGNENGLELVGFNGKEYWVNFFNLPYVNGYLAIPKNLLK